MIKLKLKLKSNL